MHNPDSFKIPLQNFQFDESTIDPAHLQFINPNPRAQEKEQSTFHLFRQLPAELRIKVSTIEYLAFEPPDLGRYVIPWESLINWDPFQNCLTECYILNPL